MILNTYLIDSINNILGLIFALPPINAMKIYLIELDADIIFNHTYFNFSSFFRSNILYKLILTRESIHSESFTLVNKITKFYVLWKRIKRKVFRNCFFQTVLVSKDGLGIKVNNVVTDQMPKGRRPKKTGYFMTSCKKVGR